MSTIWTNWSNTIPSGRNNNNDDMIIILLLLYPHVYSNLTIQIKIHNENPVVCTYENLNKNTLQFSKLVIVDIRN